MQTRPKLGEILVRLKVLSPTDVTRVLEATTLRSRRAKFGQTARDMGLVTEEAILAALAVQMELLPGLDRLTLPQLFQALESAGTP
jgi:hypothetical protein